jgi:uncharacterized protein (TIGR02646 family)
MRTIIKGPEPDSLTQHRCANHASYENLAEEAKRVLREALVEDQRGLCCYCMSRIWPQRDKMKIAHWHAQARYPDEQLDFVNLLGACRGGQGQPRSRQHCDTRQADQHISRNPANPMHRVEDAIGYAPDGSIISDDPAFDRELNGALNLNLAFLKANRKAALDGFLQSLPRKGALGRGVLERWLRDWNGESHSAELEPFCQVVVYWLRRRLARA